jgi:Glycosyltransferase family 17
VVLEQPVKRRVWETFPFSNELDLLEARLTELADHVHKFVLVESPLTYSGHPKPLYFAENKERFAPWKDKIVHVVADTSGAASSPEREHVQRNALWRGLDEYEPGDILITGDADEILHPSGLQVTSRIKIMHRHHPIAVNLMDTTPWGGYSPHCGPGRPDMLELRQRLHSRLIKPVLGKGWHFSWLGGPDAMRSKVQTLLEYEMIPRVFTSAEDYYYSKLNPGTGDRNLRLVEIDDTWPRYMRERKGPPFWYWPGPEAGSDHAPGQRAEVGDAAAAGV